MADKTEPSEIESIDLQLKALVSEINGNFQQSTGKDDLANQQVEERSMLPIFQTPVTLEPSIKVFSDVHASNAENETNASVNSNIIEPPGSSHHHLVVTATGLVKQQFVQNPSDFEITQENNLLKNHTEDKTPLDTDTSEPLPGKDLMDKYPSSDVLTPENDVKQDGYCDTIVNDENVDGIKMTLSDNMEVGSYETIEPPQSVEPDDVGKLQGYKVAGFSPMNGSISPTRKSFRPPKKKIVQDYEDFTSASAPEKQPPKKRAKMVEVLAPAKKTKKEVTKRTKQAKAGVEGSQQTKSTKKKKLQVEEVYESGDGVEDGEDDISKDLLKVRMSKCDKCDKHFLDKSKLNKHKREVHKAQQSESKKDYPCVECGYVFKRREHWRRHKEVHTVSKPFVCSICNKAFKRSEHVKRHQSVHSNEKPFACEHCPKKFTRRDHLAKHTLMHTGQANPFAKKKKFTKMITTKPKGRKRVTIHLKEESVNVNSEVKDEKDDYDDDDDDDDDVEDMLSSDEDNHTNILNERDSSTLVKIY